MLKAICAGKSSDTRIVCTGRSCAVVWARAHSPRSTGNQSARLTRVMQ